MPRTILAFMHEKLRNRLLGLWSHLISLRARTVLVIAFFSAMFCIVLTIQKLEFQPDRNDLLSRDLDWNQDFIRWQQAFPGKDDLIVIVDAGEAPTPERKAAAQALVSRLGPAVEAAAGIKNVIWGFEQGEYGPRTIRLLPMDQFHERLVELNGAATLLESETFVQMIQKIMGQLRQNDASTGGAANASSASNASNTAIVERKVVAQIDGLNHLIQAIHERFTADVNDTGKSLGELVERAAGNNPKRWRYLTEDERFYFLRVSPLQDKNTLNEYGTAIDSLRALIAKEQVAIQSADTGVRIGLTGIPVIETDETDIATSDSTKASIIAVFAILVMLVLAFHSWRAPLFAVIALLVGIAWSFGYLTFRIGHLQVISVVFTVILMGLGIAYGIHLAARFELVRPKYGKGLGGFMGAMRDSMESVGPGIITGAITTAAAFATTLFTDFKGVAEMGEIAAAGVMLCLLAMLTVFPALVRLGKRKASHVKPMDERSFHLFEERWIKPFIARPRVTLAVAGLLTVLSLGAVSRMHFDFDLLKLFPRNVDSIEWQATLAKADRPIWFGVSLCKSTDEARLFAKQLRDKETVKDVGGIGLLYPHDDEAKAAKLKLLERSLQDSLATQWAYHLKRSRDRSRPNPLKNHNVLNDFRALQLLLGLAATREIPKPIRLALERLERSVIQLAQTTETYITAERAARTYALQSEFEAWRDETGERIRKILDTSPLTRADFPDGLLSPYVAQDPEKPEGQLMYALEVYPDVPADVPSMLDPAFLPQYVADMVKIDTRVTGPAPQIFRSGVLIKESYQLAGVFALVVVFILVYLDFLKLADALLSLVPVAVGFAVTFGVMYLCGMQINPANIIVLPLMFGIGVDSGVHVIHRYRQDSQTRPLGLTAGTGKGITITSLCTMIGFGSMLTARHQGVVSLGFVLTVGIGMTMLACWTVMPAWLEIREQRKANRLRL